MQDFVSWFQSNIPNMCMALGTQITFMVKIENLFVLVTAWYAGVHRFGTSSMPVLKK